jgi:hypothetical protein
MKEISGSGGLAVRVGVAAALLCGMAPAAHAAWLTWTLQDVTFTDGGVATGQFTYNADLDLFGDYSISVSGGNTTTFPAFIYTPSSSVPQLAGANGESFFTFSGPGDPFDPDFLDRPRELRLPFLGPLPSGGGTVQLLIPSVFGAECYACDPFRAYASGSITTGGGGGGGGETPVIPEPATWAMMIAGFGLVGGMMRRRRHAQAA